MKSDLEPYEAKEEEMTLHTWTDVQGVTQENSYITGIPGALTLGRRRFRIRRTMQTCPAFPHRVLMH